MFGKIMSMTDDLVTKYFIFCTDVPLSEIDQIDAGVKAGDNPRDAKIRLAKEIVTLYHSAKDAEKAEKEFENVFKKGGLPDDIPGFKVSGSKNIIDLLEHCKLIETKSEGRRLIEQGGVKINDKKISSSDESVHLEKGMVIQVGKRRFAKII